jgi:hypothetical protein
MFEISESIETGNQKPQNNAYRIFGTETTMDFSLIMFPQCPVFKAV